MHIRVTVNKMLQELTLIMLAPAVLQKYPSSALHITLLMLGFNIGHILNISNLTNIISKYILV